MKSRAQAAAGMVVLLASCGGTGSDPPRISAPDTLPLTSPAFADMGPMPSELTCDGEGLSPTLVWSVPPTVAEWVVTMVDLDADGFAHWVAYGIPAETSSILEGMVPPGTKEGLNDFGDSGYGGPCPPGGDPHRYEFRVYALRSPATLDLPPGASLEDVLEAIECCVGVFGTITGTYGRA